MTEKEKTKKVEINFLKLKKSLGQQFIKIVKDRFKTESVINRKYKVSREDNYILFPLEANKEIIDKLINAISGSMSFELISRVGVPNPDFKPRTLQVALTGKIPDIYQYLIPKSYDIIGNIAIVDFGTPSRVGKNQINKYKGIIAKAIINVNKNVRSVFEKLSKVKGDYRLRELSYLLGKNNSETIHRENNCVFKLDIKRTYFTPRLVSERLRISKTKIYKNEVIVDMFTGVGPFSIQIAKLNPVKIYAFDLNPHAYIYLQKNLSLNKLKGKIFPYNIDVRDLINPLNQIGKILHNSVDRLIMNLPENSMNFIDILCFLMKKSGGILHFYYFSDKPNPIEKTIEALKIKLIEFKYTIHRILQSRIVKSYSPGKELIVIDASLRFLD
ncbi:MAG: class I SAM-dependent methyltransferase [Promethearchaeota archaeon]|jgi:tRNA (guanine37-N1)-methyltransferase